MNGILKMVISLPAAVDTPSTVIVTPEPSSAFHFLVR